MLRILNTKLWLPIATAFVSLSLLICLAEGLLRLTGYGPWTTTRPTMHPLHISDSRLGWINKPGIHDLPPFSETGKNIRVTFLSDGRRSAGHAVVQGSTDLVLVGGSYFQGWAISDEEALAWKLQHKLPLTTVRNYGTGGYGTYQSLLTLEGILPELSASPMVLYGFMSHHESRNVAPANWIRSLARVASSGVVYVPFVTLNNDGSMTRNPPSSYPKWPLRDSVAIVAFLEYLYVRVQDGIGKGSRYHQRRPVTERLMVEMNRLVSSFGGKFAVVVLCAKPKIRKHYMDFLKARKIQAVDCSLKLTPDLKVPGEGHPNGIANTRWTECLLNALGEEFEWPIMTPATPAN